MPAVAFLRRDLPFPGSLPEFQHLFPDDTACAAYLEAIRWRDGFVCGWCGEPGEPYRFANRPHVLRCRKCQRDNALTAGTVMERTRTPLSIWFWAAYLVSSHTPGMSAVQFQRQLGLNRYEAAFELGVVVVTDAWGGYATLPDRGYRHLPVAAHGDPSVAEDFLPISHLIFSNLKSWLGGCHHGVSPQHLQAYLNEFTFRFNRRFYPFNAFRSLLGISGQAVAPTYDGL